MWIELNAAEVKLATYLATSRRTNNRSAGIKDSQQGSQDAIQIDLNGMGAELAWCKANNVYPYTDTSRPSKAPDGTTRYGMTVDVKHSNNGSYMSIVRWAKIGDVDCYAMVIGSMPKYKIVGQISAEEALSGKYIRSGERGDYHSIPSTALEAY